jgi:hypothetical protein
VGRLGNDRAGAKRSPPNAYSRIVLALRVILSMRESFAVIEGRWALPAPQFETLELDLPHTQDHSPNENHPEYAFGGAQLSPER